MLPLATVLFITTLAVFGGAVLLAGGLFVRTWVQHMRTRVGRARESAHAWRVRHSA